MSHKEQFTGVIRREEGFTLLELLLVVGVGALLLIGAITTYRLVSDNNKVSESNRMLLTIKQEVQSLYQTRADYSGLTSVTPADDTNPLVITNIIPDSRKHPFAGTLTVVENGGDSQLFDVTFADVTQSGCIRLGTAGFNPSDLENFAIGTDTDVDPADIAEITTACATGTNGFVDMVWTFR